MPHLLGLFCEENMAIQNVDLGTYPTGEGGDSPRSGFDKVNKNFTELASSIQAINDDKLDKKDLKDASTTVSGIVQLVDALNDTSKTKAPTANQVKILNDRLNNAGVFTKAPILLDTKTDLLVDVPDVCQTFTLSGTYTNAPSIFGNGSITGMIDVKKRWFEAGVQKILTIRHLSGQIWENVKNGETWGGWKRIDAIDKLDKDASSVGSVKLDYLDRAKGKMLTGTELSTLDQGLHFDNVYAGKTQGYPIHYGHRLTFRGHGDSASELYIDWAPGQTNLFVRSKGNVNTYVWTPTKQVAFTDSDITGNAATATKLQTARKIGGVGFDGSRDINLPGVNTAGNQNTTGNAVSATKLQTPRKINGVEFSGEEDITIPTPAPNTANEIRAGILRIASQAQANIGTDDTTAISPRKLKAAVANQMNAAGSAPMYPCRAWVNINGLTNTIRSQGNVASVSRLETGRYRITFKEPMPTKDYVMFANGLSFNDGKVETNTLGYTIDSGELPSTTQATVMIWSTSTGARYTAEWLHIGIFC